MGDILAFNSVLVVFNFPAGYKNPMNVCCVDTETVDIIAKDREGNLVELNSDLVPTEQESTHHSSYILHGSDSM